MKAAHALLAALLLAPLASGSPDPADAGSPEAGDVERCSPPCGYIVPIINIDLPDRPACGGGFLVGAGERPTDCEPIMADGESVSYEGTFQWYWEVSEDGTYTNDPSEPIEVSFGGTASNPSFLQVGVEPSTFTINTADLFDPQRLETEGDPPQQQVWYRYEEPVTVTWTRAGGPTAEEAQRYEARQGIADAFLKTKSSASGETYKEAFGVEQFRFDLWTGDGAALDPPDQDTPFVPLAAVLAVLALAARLRD